MFPAQAGGGPTELGADLARGLQTLAGASVPLPTLTRLQADYLKEATELWNQSISKSGLVPQRPALRGARLAANPAAAYTA